MANPIAELIIALGVDSGNAMKVIDGVVGNIQQMASSASETINSIGKGAEEGANVGKKGMKELATAAQEAGEKGKQAGHSFIANFSPFKGLLAEIKGELKGAVGAMGAFFTIRKAFNDYLNGADELGKLSQQTRMSVSDLDAWGKATEAAGGSAQALFSSLKGFTDKTMMSGEGLIRIAQRVQGMNTIAAKSYLKSIGVAEDAIPIFMKGAKEADALVQKYRKTAFTEQDARQARTFKVAWSDFGIAASAVGNSLIRAVLPVLTKIVRIFEALTLSMKENAPLWKTIAAGMALLYAPKALTGLKSLITTMRTLGITTFLAGGIFTLIAAAIVAVGLAIDDLVTFANNGDSALESFMKSAGASSEEIEELRKGAQDIIQGFKDLWEAVKPLVGEYFSKIFKPVVTWLIRGVAQIAKWIAQIPQIPKKFEEIKQSISDAVSGFIEKVGEIPQKIAEKFTNVKTAIKDAIAKWWDEFVDGFISKIPNAIGGAFKWVGNAFGFGDDESKEVSAQQQAIAGQRGNHRTSNVSNNQNITLNAHIEGVKDADQAVEGFERTLNNMNRSAGFLPALQGGNVMTGGTD